MKKIRFFQSTYTGSTNRKVLVSSISGERISRGMTYKCCAGILLLTLTLSFASSSQDTVRMDKPDVQEMRLKLNASGTHYLKFTVLGQIWIRYNENNPGTTVLNKAATESFDIGVRRLRFQFFGQLTDHTFFYIHFGQDNFNYLSQRKFTPFLQDALAEYRIKKQSDVLVLGAGLTITGGYCRFTQPQLVNIVSMDVPIFTLPTFDLTDQAGRKVSLYARGQIGKLDYRLVLGNPFPISTSGTALPPLSPTGNPITPNSNFAQKGNHKQYQGLFIWNFFETEPRVISFMPGTYYGKKKVLNLELGFVSQKKALWSSRDAGISAAYHDLKLWSVAVYYDAPLNKKTSTALNLYAGYFNTHYGPGYMRYIGAMNPADGPPASPISFGGSYGNAFPMYASGHIIYSQAGYLFRKDLLGKNKGSLMPYATLQLSEYDRLDKQMIVFDLGLNFLINGNTSKMTLDYQNRPTYYLSGNNLVRNSSRKGQFVLQYQFFF